MLLHYFPSKSFTILLWSLTAIILPIVTIFLFSQNTILIHWEIVTLNNSSITFPIILDPLGLITSLTVLFIASNVLIFSESYIASDPNVTRFNIVVALFVLSINILIFFPNLITLLLGWDGLGLTRFLLIIYYQNPKSLGAGIITAITNRLGDAFILTSIALCLVSNNWTIINIWQRRIDIIIILSIILAAITKRAQTPFSRWLPAAIAAPTPVSALVHSSTLVTAGVFLLIRFSSFLTTLPLFNTILLISASITILIAGLSATTECDFKKIIALSTLSQLGVIIACVALGLFNMATFHLITHALFKALLFVCAGNIIHLHNHNQDLRLIGNLTHQMPLTIACISIANLSLCGAPFLAGFYSKDLILEISLFNPYNIIFVCIFFLATGATAAYSTRFMLSSSWCPRNSSPNHTIFDEDKKITTPIICLTTGAIARGSVINWTIIPVLTEPVLPPLIKILPIFVTVSGAILAWLLMTNSSTIQSLSIKLTRTHEAMTSIWFITPISSNETIRTVIPFHNLLKTVDHGWMENISAQGIFKSINTLTNKSQTIQANTITTFLTTALLISAPIILLL